MKLKDMKMLSDGPEKFDPADVLPEEIRLHWTVQLRVMSILNGFTAVFVGMWGATSTCSSFYRGVLRDEGVNDPELYEIFGVGYETIFLWLMVLGLIGSIALGFYQRSKSAELERALKAQAER